MEKLIRTTEEKWEKNSLTDAFFKCLSLLPNVNINFYVNKYLLRSWLGVKLQARLWGHNGEQYTCNMKAHHLEKIHPYGLLTLLVYLSRASYAKAL